MLDDGGDTDLDHLATQGSFLRQEKIFDQLLRQSTPPLGRSSSKQVCPRRADDAPQVDALVFKEPLIFGGQEGFQQERRDVIKLDHPSFFQHLVIEPSNGLGFKIHRQQFRSFIQVSQTLDASAAKGEADPLSPSLGAGVGQIMQKDVHLSFLWIVVILAPRLDGSSNRAIIEMSKPIEQVYFANVDARIEQRCLSVEFRRHLPLMSREASHDLALKFAVELPP